MNQILDELIIRIFFAFYILLFIYIYKFLHFILYPHGKKQVFSILDPTENPSYTLHYFARILGGSIVLSNLDIIYKNGLTWGILGFSIQGICIFSIFLLSLFILESITMYNFEYKDEIINKKNITYASVSFLQAICIAIIIQTCVKLSLPSISTLFFLWLFSIVLLGIFNKLYKFYSKISFNNMIFNNSSSLFFSYAGYLMGITLIVDLSLQQNTRSLNLYISLVLIKIILSLLIVPIFIHGLKFVFRIKDEQTRHIPLINGENPQVNKNYNSAGFAMSEGGLFFSACLLASLIIQGSNFGIF